MEGSSPFVVSRGAGVLNTREIDKRTREGFFTFRKLSRDGEKPEHLTDEEFRQVEADKTLIQDLLCRLLEPRPENRRCFANTDKTLLKLEFDEEASLFDRIRSHPIFEDFNWEDFLAKKITSPLELPERYVASAMDSLVGPSEPVSVPIPAEIFELDMIAAPKPGCFCC